jgi:hypothetical protein
VIDAARRWPLAFADEFADFFLFGSPVWRADRAAGGVAPFAKCQRSEISFFHGASLTARAIQSA